MPMIDKEIHTIQSTDGNKHAVSSNALIEVADVRKNSSSVTRHFAKMANLEDDYNISYSCYSKNTYINAEIALEGTVDDKGEPISSIATSDNALDTARYSKLCIVSASKGTWDGAHYTRTSIIPVDFLSTTPQRVVLYLGSNGSLKTRYEFDISLDSSKKIVIKIVDAPAAGNDTNYRTSHVMVWGMK